MKFDWFPIRSFNSPAEFEEFYTWLELQIHEGVAERVSLLEPSKGSIFGLKEERFKCKKSDAIWRLIFPNFPFRGLWEPIETCSIDSHS